MKVEVKEGWMGVGWLKTEVEVGKRDDKGLVWVKPLLIVWGVLNIEVVPVFKFWVEEGVKIGVEGVKIEAEGVLLVNKELVWFKLLWLAVLKGVGLVKLEEENVEVVGVFNVEGVNEEVGWLKIEEVGVVLELKIEEEGALLVNKEPVWLIEEGFKLEVVIEGEVFKLEEVKEGVKEEGVVELKIEEPPNPKGLFSLVIAPKELTALCAGFLPKE